MELKVWVDGIQRIVCGVTQATTCQDVVFALAHATSTTGRFTLIERWRSNERLLAPSQHPLKVLLKWGEHASDVQFILQRTSLNYKNGHNLSSRTPISPEADSPELQIDSESGQQRHLQAATRNRNHICNNNNTHGDGLSPSSNTPVGGARDIRKSLTFSGAMVSREARASGRGVPSYDSAKVEYSSAGLPDVSNVKFGAPSAVCVSTAIHFMDTNTKLNSSNITEMSSLSPANFSSRQHELQQQGVFLSHELLPASTSHHISGTQNQLPRSNPHITSRSSQPSPSSPASFFHDRHSPLKTPPIIPPSGTRPPAPPPYEQVRGYPPSPPLYGGSIRRRGYRHSPSKSAVHHMRQHSSPALPSCNQDAVAASSTIRTLTSGTSSSFYTPQYMPSNMSANFHSSQNINPNTNPLKLEYSRSDSPNYYYSSPSYTQSRHQNNERLQSPTSHLSSADNRTSSANEPRQCNQQQESPYGYANSSPHKAFVAAGQVLHSPKNDNFPIVSNSSVGNCSKVNVFHPSTQSSNIVDENGCARRSAFKAISNKSEVTVPQRMLPPYRPPPPPPSATKVTPSTIGGHCMSSDGRHAPTTSSPLVLTTVYGGRHALSHGSISPPSALHHHKNNVVPPSPTSENNASLSYSSVTNHRVDDGSIFSKGKNSVMVSNNELVASSRTVASGQTAWPKPNHSCDSHLNSPNSGLLLLKNSTTELNGYDSNWQLRESIKKSNFSNGQLDSTNSGNGFLITSSKSVTNSSSSSVVSLSKCSSSPSASSRSETKIDVTSSPKNPYIHGFEEVHHSMQSSIVSINGSASINHVRANSVPGSSSSPCKNLASRTSPSGLLEDSVLSTEHEAVVTSNSQNWMNERLEISSTNTSGKIDHNVAESKNESSKERGAEDANYLSKVSDSSVEAATHGDCSVEGRTKLIHDEELEEAEEEESGRSPSPQGHIFPPTEPAPSVMGRQVEHIVLDNVHQDLVALVNQQRDQLTGQQIQLTKFEAEITYLEGRWREDQAKLDFAHSEMERLSLLHQKLDEELRAEDPDAEEEKLKSVIDTKERLSQEMISVRQQIHQCDAQIAHLTSNITSLEEELLSLKLANDEKLLEIGEDEDGFDFYPRDAEYSQNSTEVPSPELAKVLEEVESALAGKREQVEELKRAMMSENLEALSLTPPDRLAASLHAPTGAAAAVCGVSRRIIGSPRMLETAVPTSKNPHGVWV
ncbi:flocculation protein FLO11 isoform X2 [Hyalella azteca]|uniref:Flocculation protein FLO11 isoform X2 n=1 Tax=Hyalella azteca TaxID=294128 RepID=A0A8B7NVH6_HYAAZ|nr:flocculation protein FLO11 isoform X2 [Hyalella azteca]